MMEIARLKVVCVPSNGLHPRPEGGSAFTVETFPDEHAGAPHASIGCQLFGEPRLAAARLAADEEQSPAPRQGFFEPLAQLRDLLGPAHKHAAGKPVQ